MLTKIKISAHRELTKCLNLTLTQTSRPYFEIMCRNKKIGGNQPLSAPLTPYYIPIFCWSGNFSGIWMDGGAYPQASGRGPLLSAQNYPPVTEKFRFAQICLRSALVPTTSATSSRSSCAYGNTSGLGGRPSWYDAQILADG